jgi:hypothetical protein
MANPGQRRRGDHAADGWRITQRICRIAWWTGNPFVNETIPGIKFDLATSVLHAKTDAGHVGVLNAGHRNRDAPTVDRRP